MKTAVKLAVNFTLIGILLVGMIVGNVIAFRYENEINSLLSQPIVDTEALEQTSSTGQAMSKRIMEEGAVLLKNDGTLPLDRSAVKQVNVFGWRSVDWIYGSEGFNASGGVAPEDGDFSKNVDIYKALNSYGVSYNQRLYDMYCRYYTPDHQSADLRGVRITSLIQLREPPIDNATYYDEGLLQFTKDYSDTALVVIGRMAGEGMNPSTTMQEKKGNGVVNDSTRHYLEISTEEEKLLTWVGANFENVIVILNVANPFECGFLETIEGIDACLSVGFTGTRAAAAIPSLLYGDVSPSGRTVDVYPYDAFTNPGSVFLTHSYADNGCTYSDFVENIYVGYKWYETADVMGVWDDVENDYGTGYEGVVQFPFGYGLSYTDFKWEVQEISVEPGTSITDKTKFTFTVNVTNTGTVAGRDVVEVYATMPWTAGGIEKPSVQLVGYNKTSVLQPGNTETVTVDVDAYDLLSYDCYDKNNNSFKGYELEAGTYTLKLQTDSHTVKQVTYGGEERAGTFDYVVDETIRVETDPVTGAKVGNLFTGEDTIDVVPLDGSSKDGSFDPEIPWLTRDAFTKPAEWAELSQARNITPGAKSDASFTQEQIEEWDNAAVDKFGDPVDTSPVTWGANNGKKLAENGIITELGRKLAADYNDPDWEAVLDQITTDEVVSEVSGYYGSAAIGSVGKPVLADYDGPAQIKGFAAAPRGTGYPTMVVIAQTWNPSLAYEFGKSYGDDMKALGVYGMWGWSLDLHRTAFCGRNHESPSEDAFLAGSIIMNAVKGLNTRGRYCFLKHFALYNVSGYHVWTTEQALRETYLRSFRKAFVEGGALGAMTTYAGVGGEHSETSEALITGVLRKEWAFKGAVTTDSISNNTWCASILRMGGNFGMGVRLDKAVSSYDASSPIRLQHRMRDAMHQILYMWLRADYNEQQYLAAPDANDTVVISNSINSWSWWQPTIYVLDAAIGIACFTWATLLCVNIFVFGKKQDGGKKS